MITLTELLDARNRLEESIRRWMEEFFPPRPAQLVQLRLLNEAIERCRANGGAKR